MPLLMLLKRSCLSAGLLWLRLSLAQRCGRRCLLRLRTVCSEPPVTLRRMRIYRALRLAVCALYMVAALAPRCLTQVEVELIASPMVRLSCVLAVETMSRCFHVARCVTLQNAFEPILHTGWAYIA